MSKGGVLLGSEKKVFDKYTRYDKYISMWPNIVKVTKYKSSSVINIPVKLARETGIDKAEYVLITKSANNKLEIKRYDKEGDVKEYIQGDIDELNRPSK